ncbi:MAG: tyrosine-type recombinase/integrase [Flavobacteriales bacterium]|nr:tyrosine-type recombinase/integrase [Flavobacteriales bacterium]
MASISPIIRANRATANDTVPIQIRVTYKRNSCKINIGHRIKQRDWDDEKKRVKKSHDNSVRLNNLIQNFISKIDNYIIEKEASNEPVVFAEIKEKVFNKTNTANTFKEYSLEYLEDLHKEKKYAQFGSSRAQVNKMIAFFGDYATFSALTVNHIKKFKVFLKSDYNQSQRSIVNHLIVLRAICNKAIRDGLMNKNDYPFGGEGVVIRIPNSIKVGLNLEEIKLLELAKIKSFTSKWNARNAFLLSFYFAGARISDVLRIKWTDIVDGRLHYKMGKNNKVGSIAVAKKANDILEQYKTKRWSKEEFVLPELNNADLSDEKDVYRKIITATKKYNKWLKKLANEVGIEKKVTCHIARHSFGNISGDKIPVQMLQKLYRHSDITTTINYQQSFINKDTDDALALVIGDD